jgi:hypothetical protein
MAFDLRLVKTATDAAADRAGHRCRRLALSGPRHSARCERDARVHQRARAHAPLLEEAYYDCEKALLYWSGPYVLSQGDFAPWNTRTFGSQLFVFDWGSAHADASPLDDVLH